MIAEEEIAQKRRDEYDKQIRVFFPRAMSENGGILTNGFTEEEMETKAKDLLVLQRKPGFCKDDDTATFGSV